MQVYLALAWQIKSHYHLRQEKLQVSDYPALGLPPLSHFWVWKLLDFICVFPLSYTSHSAVKSSDWQKYFPHLLSSSGCYF